MSAHGNDGYISIFLGNENAYIFSMWEQVMQTLYSLNKRLCKSGTLLILLAFICCPAHANTLRERQQAVEHLFDAPCARYQVPKALALAIARTESGCRPWILNLAGRDVRPDSREKALRLARTALHSGRSFDVGIMQVNAYWIRKYRWPLEQVLEPATNVRIGVWILAQEIRRHGLNWKAVASYHTPLHKNPERGRVYARTVYGHVKNILAEK